MDRIQQCPYLHLNCLPRYSLCGLSRSICNLMSKLMSLFQRLKILICSVSSLIHYSPSLNTQFPLPVERRHCCAWSLNVCQVSVCLLCTDCVSYLLSFLHGKATKSPKQGAEDQGPRRLKHTLRSKCIADVQPYLEADGSLG